MVCKRVGPNCTDAKPEKCFSQCSGHDGVPALDAPPGGWSWVDAGGLNGTDFIELGPVGSSPQDPANAFDSHSKIVILSRFVAVRLANPKSITISVCFAAMQPTTVGDRERVYYMVRTSLRLLVATV